MKDKSDQKNKNKKIIKDKGDWENTWLYTRTYMKPQKTLLIWHKSKKRPTCISTK